MFATLNYLVRVKLVLGIYWRNSGEMKEVIQQRYTGIKELTILKSGFNENSHEK